MKLKLGSVQAIHVLPNGDSNAATFHFQCCRPLFGRKWKHNRVVTPKPLDKLNKDYERKARQTKKKQSEAGEEGGGTSSAKRKKPEAHLRGKPISRVRTELKTVDQIRKARHLQERKKLKNARPTKKGRR